MLYLLIQVTPIVPEIKDGLQAGTAGWVIAALFALINFVFGWLLFKHLPAKDQLITQLIKDKDAHAEKLSERYENRMTAMTNALNTAIAAFQQEIRESKADFRAALKDVLDHCKEEGEKLIDAFNRRKD